MAEKIMGQPVVSQSITISDILGNPLSKEEALALIESNSRARKLYLDFPEKVRENLLSFIQGSRGLPILYDTFFKHIMDPIYHPHRLEHFLSAILNQKVHIKQVLPKEGIKLSENGSLVIMDIVVELEDGSIIDVEMQKVGYQFSGQRSSCYASDLVMRQYNRIKNQKKDEFSFKDMKPVYLIILMEHSAREFLKVAPAYIHKGYHQFDSGAQMELLTNICYISLDTFHNVVHNINSSQDAWLTFLSSDKPEDILRLVKAYPEFMECYHDIAEFRRKPEELMSMFTDAFIVAERNTVKYMCEEQQKEIKEQQKTIEIQKEEIEKNKQKLSEQDAKLTEQTAKLSEQDAMLSEQMQENAQLRARLQEFQQKQDELQKQIELLKNPNML